MDKKDLFENMNPSKALAVMALPTIASQMIILIYNLADTWFIGRTGNPYMIGASSLALTVYLASVALANVFGVGGRREIGEELRKLYGITEIEATSQKNSITIRREIMLKHVNEDI